MDNGKSEDISEIIEGVEEEEGEMNFFGSEEMKFGIDRIFERVERFN